MTAEVSIDHGVPDWLSPSIIPSTQDPQSIATAPMLASVSVNSTDVYVYVKVENTGDQDLGVCTCTSTLAWNGVIPFGFSDFSPNVNTSVNPNDSSQSITLDATNDDVLLIGGNSYPLNGGAIPNPHHRAWGWSADGRFLGYVRTLTASSTAASSDWKLSIFALQTFTDSEGTVFSPGDEIVSQSGAIWTWNNNFFRWAGSNAVLALGPNDPDHPLQLNGADILEWYALCPSAPANSKVWHMFAPHKNTTMGTLSSWSYVFSPCESFVAFMGHMAAQGQANIVLLSAEQGTTAQFTSNNAHINPPATNGPSPSISTMTHTANGVTIKLGDGMATSTIQVDDPECTALPDTVQVVVDRVKGSTLLTANLGVVSVGQASAGPLLVAESKWVQVPNQNANGWGKNQANQANNIGVLWRRRSRRMERRLPAPGTVRQ
jgi:hypothetical protein